MRLVVPTINDTFNKGGGEQKEKCEGTEAADDITVGDEEGQFVIEGKPEMKGGRLPPWTLFHNTPLFVNQSGDAGVTAAGDGAAGLYSP